MSAAIEQAEREAREHGHRVIDLQHLFLGVLLVADGPVAHALAELGSDESGIRAIVAGAGQDGKLPPPNRRLPVAARARVASELARREADRRKSKQLRLEHLLLGIALVGDGLEHSFLRDAGITADRVRAAVLS